MQFMMEYTAESELILRAKSGDQQAFEELHRVYSPWVYRVALRFLGRAEDARDVAQDVWLKVYMHLPHFEHRSRLSTWLYRAVRNRVVDFVRRRGVREETARRFLAVGEYQGCTTGDPTDHLEAVEHRELVAQLMDGLPSTYRRVLVERELKGRSIHQLAHTQGVAVGTIKSRLHRAHQALRRQAQNVTWAG